MGLGPNATNQLLGSWPAWFEAVPVLPARFHEEGKPWKSPYAVPFGFEITPSNPWRMAE